MMRLDVGAGPDSVCEIQIDKFKFPRTTYVLDAMTENWPVESESIDEVRMEQFLEHCPVSVRAYRFLEPTLNGIPLVQQTIFYPRIHCMREAFRVLKKKGVLHVSVPGTLETHCQDPTHEGPMINEEFFKYFCGGYGGGHPGSFANDSYGINFIFTKLEAYMTGPILTVRLMKE